MAPSEETRTADVGEREAPASRAQSTPCDDRRRSERAPLSRDRIVDAAMCYVDANCLDDLSMRRLGGELGVEAMSLYRYFPSKAALLDGVVCHALSGLQLPPARGREGGAWESDVRAYAHSFRLLARGHPRLMPLLATTGPSNSTLADITARMVAVWERAGLETATARRAQIALQGYVTGSILADVSGSETDDDFEFGLDAFINGLRGFVRAQPDPGYRSPRR